MLSIKVSREKLPTAPNPVLKSSPKAELFGLQAAVRREYF
jgi:hypothetical protein